MKENRDFLEVRRKGKFVLLDYSEGEIRLEKVKARKLSQTLKRIPNKIGDRVPISRELELRLMQNYIELTCIIDRKDEIEEKIYQLSNENAMTLARGIDKAILSIS